MRAWSRRTAMGGLAALPIVLIGERARAADAVRAPLFRLSGKLFTTASVNGVKADALIDSGSQVSVVDKAFARELGLSVLPGYRFGGVQSGVWGGAGGPVKIEVAGFAFTAPKVAVVDLAPIAAQLQRPFQITLGRDLFEHFVVEFDFGRNELILTTAGAFKPAAGMRAVEIRPKAGRMTVATKIDAAAPLQASIDLGADTPLIVDPALARERRLLTGRRVSTAELGGYGRPVVGQVFTAGVLAIGGEEFRNVPVQVPPRPIGFEAIVGLEVLRRFHLALDYAGRRAWFSPDTAKAEPFPKDLTGLNGRMDGGMLRITHVARGGPAEQSGWRVGDLVTAIDGQAAAFGNAALGEAAKPGQVVEFTMANGLKRRLVLSEYY